MACIISGQRRFFGLVTLGTIIDAIFAHHLFLIMSNSLKQIDWTTQIYIVFILFPCINLRISIGWIFMDSVHSWNHASSSIRACYIMHFILSGTIRLSIFNHCIMLFVWLTWRYLLFLGSLSGIS